MVLTNQLIYLVNDKTMRKIFSNYMCFSKIPNFTIQDKTLQLLVGLLLTHYGWNQLILCKKNVKLFVIDSVGRKFTPEIAKKSTKNINVLKKFTKIVTKSLQIVFRKVFKVVSSFCKKAGPKVSTTPITKMGCQQCLSISVVQLKGKHCQIPHYRNEVVCSVGHALVLA